MTGKLDHINGLIEVLLNEKAEFGDRDDAAMNLEKEWGRALIIALWIDRQ